MKLFLRSTLGIILIFSFLFFSCKKETCFNCGTPQNRLPVAVTDGYIETTVPEDSVMLAGINSYDADGVITSFAWIKVQGPAGGNPANRDSANTWVKNLEEGDYQFELTVTDNEGGEGKATLHVRVNDPFTDHLPVACAGVDQFVQLPVNFATLQGECSSDLDNDISSYRWTKIGGPASFSIVHPDSAKTLVNGLVEGTYLFKLEVIDQTSQSSSDTVTLHVIAPPFDCNLNNLPTTNTQLVPLGFLSQPRRLMAVVAAGSKIFYAGGFTASGNSGIVDIYDINTHSWSTASLSVPRFWMATAVSGNKVFFAGGETGIGNVTAPVSTVDVYDLSTGNWSVENLSLPGESIAAATVGNKVLFAGGDGAGNGRQRRVDIYDVPTGSWTTATLSGDYFEGHTAIGVNNKVYIAGGTAASGQYRAIDIFDNSTGTWSTSNMLDGKTFFSNVAVGEKIYWGGGWMGSWSTCQLEVRDVNSGTSVRKGIGIETMFDGNAGMNAVVQNQRIVFPFQNTFTMYDTQTDTWSTGMFPNPDYFTTFVSVNDEIYTTTAPSGGLTHAVWKVVF